MTISIKYRDEEVKSQAARIAIGIFVLVTFPFFVAFLLATIPLHFLLLLFGRKGFWERTPDGKWNYDVALEGFKAK